MTLSLTKTFAPIYPPQQHIQLKQGQPIAYHNYSNNRPDKESRKLWMQVFFDGIDKIKVKEKDFKVYLMHA